MKLDFKSDNGYGGDGALGLIVLETDETIEPELRPLMLAAQKQLYHSRIAFNETVTPETLARMEQDIPKTAGLLSRHISFNVIGYGCTSAATVIGEERVRELVQSQHAGAKVTNPISAVIAAGRALGAKKIGFLTPYAPDVSLAMRKTLEKAGFEIASFASFEEDQDHEVARISEESVLEGMKHVGKSGADMVFSSCTNLRSFNVIKDAEDALDIPVISSNSALAWHMLRLAGSNQNAPHLGRLFSA